MGVVLGLAGLLAGCGGQLTPDEAKLLDAVAFVTGGEREGTAPPSVETGWRRSVQENEIEYQSSGHYAGFGQPNDPHRESRYVRIALRINSPEKCVFKIVVTAAHSSGAREEGFKTTVHETTTWDLNKVHRFDIDRGDGPSVVIEGAAPMCKDGKCRDDIKIRISPNRKHELARMIEIKQQAVEFIRKACPGRAR